ncbi:MAG: hypothetical protein ACYTE8_00435 [Planctomycetota bacterium]|jgi:hypothetical protein
MTIAIQVTNNATGSLDSGITAIATTLDVKAGEGALFPSTAGSNYFYATLQADSGAWEVIKVTTRATDTFSVIVRNVDSSTGAAQAFSADDIVSLRPVASIISDLVTELNLMNPTNTLTAPAGTKMIFYQDTAPTGWTIDSDPADHLLAIKGGAQAYNANGGTKAGTWDQANHTHTGPSHTHTMGTHLHGQSAHLHTTAGHTLLLSEIPAHTHTQACYWTETTSTPLGAGIGKGSATNYATSSAGGGGSHTHGNTGSTDAGNTDAVDPGDTNAGGTGATGGSKTLTTWRPQAALCIVATKD